MSVKSTLTTLLVLFCFFQSQSQTTSVSNGNWTSPSTWGGVPPTPGSTVIINHAVIMDIDYSYNSGSITINASGSLTGSSNMRGFALSGGALTVNGTFNIARVGLFSGTVINSGTFQSDSLLNQTTFQNASGGTINAPQFMIGAGGVLTNAGTVVSTNFLNIDTVTNTGSISSNDFMNTKRFINSSTGVINTSADFLNADSLSLTAIFTNDGSVNVGNDWQNRSQINGSGKFCVAQNTKNSGTISGTLDFCDQTGGSFDLNTGTVAGTVTYCQYSCSVGLTESNSSMTLEIFPNPNNGHFTITPDLRSSKVEIIDILGNCIYKTQTNGLQTDIQLANQAKGIYFCRISDKNNTVIKTGKIIID
jgi:hypothetical protein